MSNHTERISVSEFCNEFGLDQINRFASTKMFSNIGNKTRKEWKDLMTSNGIVVKKEVEEEKEVVIKKSPKKSVSEEVLDKKIEKNSTKNK